MAKAKITKVCRVQRILNLIRANEERMQKAFEAVEKIEGENEPSLYRPARVLVGRYYKSPKCEPMYAETHAEIDSRREQLNSVIARSAAQSDAYAAETRRLHQQLDLDTATQEIYRKHIGLTAAEAEVAACRAEDERLSKQLLGLQPKTPTELALKAVIARDLWGEGLPMFDHDALIPALVRDITRLFPSQSAPNRRAK